MNIKRLFFCLVVMAGCAFVSSAQKFALVDMEYVLSNIPSYEVGNKNLEQMSQRWQKEVEAVSLEAETMYKNYQASSRCSPMRRKKRKSPRLWPRKRRLPRSVTSISWAGRRAFPASAADDASHTGRDIQCSEADQRRAWLHVYLRPCIGRRHNLCLPTHRREQRGARQARHCTLMDEL